MNMPYIRLSLSLIQRWPSPTLYSCVDWSEKFPLRSTNVIKWLFCMIGISIAPPTIALLELGATNTSALVFHSFCWAVTQAGEKAKTTAEARAVFLKVG